MTISGYHTGGKDSLFQFGKSKDNPALRQVKLMMATLDPLAQQQSLERRLERATAKLNALTPPRGRGKRQITEEAILVAAAEAILHKYQVVGSLSYTFECQVKQQIKYVGCGQGAAARPQCVGERVRYQITAVICDEAAITALQQRFFVKRDDQVRGLINLLSIAVRLLTLMEFIVRRALKRENAQLVGLHKENPKKPTDKPTTERLLQAFSNINLTIIRFPDRTCGT